MRGLRADICQVIEHVIQQVIDQLIDQVIAEPASASPF